MSQFVATLSAIALASLAVAPDTARPKLEIARAQEKLDLAVYLPRLDLLTQLDPTSATIVPCAGPSTIETDADGWEVVCGGFGRIRDLFAIPFERDSGIGRVLAIGDGVGLLSLLVEPELRTSWRGIALQEDLTGLRAIDALPGASCPSGRPCAWAVGERHRMAFTDPSAGRPLDLQALKWRRLRNAHGAPLERQQYLLEAVVLRDGGPVEGTWPIDITGLLVEGWAAGGAGDEAFVAQLVHTSGDQPLWSHRTWDVNQMESLPALSSMRVISPGPGQPIQGWTIGGDGESAVVADLVPAFVIDGRTVYRWRRAGTLSGSPRDLLLDEPGVGWAFGETSIDGPVASQGATTGVGMWVLEQPPEGGPPRWSTLPVRTLPGRRLVDAYRRRVLGELGESFLAVAPTTQDNDVAQVFRYEGEGQPDPESWLPVGASSTTGFETIMEGSSAFAPVGLDHGVLAVGDAVWLLNLRGEQEPRSLRRRLQLSAAAPVASGDAWLLGREGGAGTLYLLRDNHIHETLVDLVPQDVIAMDRSSASTWALTVDGDIWRTGTSTRDADWLRLRAAAPMPALSVLDVAEDGTVWAAGPAPGGGTRIMRFDDGGRRWVEVAVAASGSGAAVEPTDLSVTAAADGYTGVLAGALEGSSTGIIVEFADPSIVGPCASMPTGDIGTQCPTGTCCRAWRLPGNVPTAVAASPDRLWLAYPGAVVRRPTSSWAWATPALLVSGLPDGCGQPSCLLPAHGRITDLAPGPGLLIAIWQDERLGPSRAASHILHLACESCDGGADLWTHEGIVNVPLAEGRVVADGSGATLWLSGDWSTIIRRRLWPPALRAPQEAMMDSRSVDAQR